MSRGTSSCFILFDNSLGQNQVRRQIFICCAVFAREAIYWLSKEFPDVAAASLNLSPSSDLDQW